MNDIDVFRNVEDEFNSGSETNIENIRIIKNRDSKIKEGDYLKVYKYTNTLFAFKGIPLSYVPIIIEIGRYMSYAEDGQIVVLNKYIKDKIAETLNIKMDRINQSIRELKDFDVLRPTGSRGVYAVNPFVIGCGDRLQIEELRAQFDFNANLMEQKNTTRNLITGQVIHSVTRERRNKQIPGQQSLFDSQYLGEDAQKPIPTKPKKKGKSGFNNIMQHDYNFDEIEAGLLNQDSTAGE